MTERSTLEKLPMTSVYFRLILRSFGDTPEHRAAVLAGTGVTDDMLRDRSADISAFQQVRQVENVIGLFGEGWAARVPELWDNSSHGALTVAAVVAPNLAGIMEVLSRFVFVRGPFHRASLRRGPRRSRLSIEPAVVLPEKVWRSLIEILFISVRATLTSVLMAPPSEVRFHFAWPEPAHAAEVRAVLGESVVYNASDNAIEFPSVWFTLESPFADATLYDAALGELRAASARIAAPVDLRGRVERLLSSLPSGRCTADHAARLLGVSSRTLVRRLAEAGVSYRELVDAELRGRAERLLKEGGLSRARIAEELGYSDPSSLSRACRRWFGSRRTAGSSTASLG
ncbi:MAG TPA: helix-turn-helix domain-containing protein [Parvibaculum sp.]